MADDTRQRRAFVMVYAVGTMVLVSSLALTLMDSIGSDVEVARTRANLVLARTAAESGIEYAMAFVTRQLGRMADYANGIQGGPWSDLNFDGGTRVGQSVFEPDPAQVEHPWFYAARAYNKPLGSGITSRESQAEGRPIRLHGIDPLEGEPPVGTPQSQVLQFQISMTPEMTYANVYQATRNRRRPTVFTVRSRGEVLRNPGSGPIVLASAYVMQTFIVGEPDGTCGGPRPTRQVFDREPETLTPGIIWPAPPDPSAMVPRDQRLKAPNPH